MLALTKKKPLVRVCCSCQHEQTNTYTEPCATCFSENGDFTKYTAKNDCFITLELAVYLLASGAIAFFAFISAAEAVCRSMGFSLFH